MLHPAQDFLMMYSVSKLNKQGDNIQPWCTPFPIWNQSVVPCPVPTVASWPAYRFLKRQVRWPDIPISFRIFHSLLWSTQSCGLFHLKDMNKKLWKMFWPKNFVLRQYKFRHGFCLLKSSLLMKNALSSVFARWTDIILPHYGHCSIFRGVVLGVLIMLTD